MIASVGPSLPLDLLSATGRYRGPLGWNADRATPTADRWLENKFPIWSRSILEDWAAGAWDDLDMVIFSRVDDAAQRLYYYVCELQRLRAIGGPEPILLDTAKIRRSSSRDHTIASVRRLAERLAVSDATLEASIATSNRLRAQQADRRGERICLLAGTPPPDRRLHAAIEGQGFAALGPTLDDIWRDLGPSVDEASGDPAAAIGRQLHERADDQRGFENQAMALAERARDTGARAAVLWYTDEDESRIWNVPASQRALADDGVPTLILSRRDWAGNDGAGEEIRHFLEGLSK